MQIARDLLHGIILDRKLAELISSDNGPEPGFSWESLVPETAHRFSRSFVWARGNYFRSR